MQINNFFLQLRNEIDYPRKTNVVYNPYRNYISN